MITTTAPAVFRKGDRITHLGHPATVTIGNDPADGWGTSPVISIRYDKAPRGHSACKDVLAGEVTPLAEEA